MSTISPSSPEGAEKSKASNSQGVSSDTVNVKVKFTDEEIKRIEDKLRSQDFSETFLGVSVKADLATNKVIPVDEERIALKFPEWFPSWDPFDKYEPYKPFAWTDRGLAADANYTNLFPDGFKANAKNLTPKFGTVVKGIQLSQLNESAKNELARCVAERGVLVFRDQDLNERGPAFAAEFAEYFGPLHIHPTGGSPLSSSKIHLIYRPKSINDGAFFLYKNKTCCTIFHSDISFEAQPPAITFLGMLEGPEIGGDTVFVDTVQAYERLSPEFQKFLERLKARHTDVNGPLLPRSEFDLSRRASGTAVHSVVRTIESTGKKALFVNPIFTEKIEGVKEEESAAILGFLYNHLHTSVDLHVRVRWEPGTVIVMDNRRIEHTGLYDWDSNCRRHMWRMTPMAEVPH